MAYQEADTCSTTDYMYAAKGVSYLHALTKLNHVPVDRLSVHVMSTKCGEGR